MNLCESNDNSLMEIIERKAQPYYERGMDAVIESRPLRTFGEAAEIIKTRFAEHGISEGLAESFACVFARAYIAGVVAAARLVTPELVVQLEPCLEVQV